MVNKCILPGKIMLLIDLNKNPGFAGIFLFIVRGYYLRDRVNRNPTSQFIVAN